MAQHMLREYPEASCGYMRTMRLQDAMEEDDGMLWPEWMVPKVREVLQQYANFTKEGELSKCWTPKPEARLNENALRQLLSPEDLCMLESSLEAAHRLKQLNVTRLVHPDNLEKYFDRLKGSVSQKVRKRAIAIFIEEELQLTPWTLTANFYHFMHGHCQLALRGVADPSGCGEGHAYTRVERRANEIVDDGGAPKPPREKRDDVRHTGTDSDLRKLTIEDCVQWLLPHGYTREQVKALPRWDRIAAIRAIATKQAAEGLDPHHKFARENQRIDQQQLRADYSSLAAQIWQAQLASLSRGDPPEPESDSDDDDDFESELQSAMEAQAPEALQEAHDARELELMRRERVGGGGGTSSLLRPREEGAEAGAEARAETGTEARAETGRGSRVECEGNGCGRRRMVKTGRKVLRIKQWVEEEDTGNFKEIVTEWTQDTEEGNQKIKEYIKKQRKEARRHRMVLTAEEEHDDREQKRERHRVLEQLRRERERKKKILELQENIKSGVVITGEGIQCSRCKGFGHTKSSRSCPLFDVTQSEEKKPMAYEQALFSEPSSLCIALGHALALVHVFVFAISQMSTRPILPFRARTHLSVQPPYSSHPHRRCPVAAPSQSLLASSPSHQGLVKQLGHDREGQLRLSISGQVREKELKLKIDTKKTKEYKDKAAEEEFRRNARSCAFCWVVKGWLLPGRVLPSCVLFAPPGLLPGRWSRATPTRAPPPGAAASGARLAALRSSSMESLRRWCPN